MRTAQFVDLAGMDVEQRRRVGPAGSHQVVLITVIGEHQPVPIQLRQHVHARRRVDRVDHVLHVHLKDVDTAKMAEVRAEGGDLVLDVVRPDPGVAAVSASVPITIMM